MKITLEQWTCLVAVVDEGSYAKAAEKLNKSQSAVSYAVQKLEEQLELSVFRIEGRKAVLTDAGKALYQQAGYILEGGRQAEALAWHFKSGTDARIRIATDAIFSNELLFCALSHFADQAPFVRIELLETVLSGTNETLVRGDAEIVISYNVPPGFSGDPLLRIEMMAVAHPDHPLHQLDRQLTYNDLKQYRQLVVRDSGSRRVDSGWLGADMRWTVSNISTSIHAVTKGLGFSWFPKWRIRDELDQGKLKPLPLEIGESRFAELYLIMRDSELASPSVKQLCKLIEESVNDYLATGKTSP